MRIEEMTASDQSLRKIHVTSTHHDDNTAIGMISRRISGFQQWRLHHWIRHGLIKQHTKYLRGGMKIGETPAIYHSEKSKSIFNQNSFHFDPFDI
jgi:hypothetical protein